MLEHKYLDIIAGRSRGPLAGLARGVLLAAELPYRGLMQLRNRRYDAQPQRSHGLGRPTVSVGNITAGGTGKTPVVQWLASSLRSAGHHPAVLMRGYRKGGSAISDEQVMLQQLLPGLPVEANPDRIAGAAEVLRRDATTTCFVLDDGFQHRRAGRDFDLVLIHAAQPFGFGHVHPRGLLREPLAGLARADAILITHASEVLPEQLLATQHTIRQYASAPIFHCDHVNSRLLSADDSQSLELSDLATRPFFFFAGIGQPQQLAASLRRFPVAYKGERFFDDHHHYTVQDLAGLAESREAAGARVVVTTEKDWAKLRPLWQSMVSVPPLYRLQLEVRFWEEEELPLLQMIGSALAGS